LPTLCQRFANAAIAHFIFSNATSQIKKIKRAIAPSLQTLVAKTEGSFLTYTLTTKKKKQKAVASPPLIFYFGRHLLITLNNTFTT
jgi:hypothetical protein